MLLQFTRTPLGVIEVLRRIRGSRFKPEGDADRANVGGERGFSFGGRLGLPSCHIRLTSYTITGQDWRRHSRPAICPAQRRSASRCRTDRAFGQLTYIDRYYYNNNNYLSHGR